MRNARLSSVLALFCFILLLSIHANAQATCTLSTTNRTVTICTPASGATVGTTFHVNAGTTDSATVQYMQVYVNSKLYATQYRKFLDANITVPAGTKENLTVQAKDATGFMKKTYFINVSVGSTYKISPLNPTVSEGATQQFTATTASTWTASCGSITSSGLFTAPLKQTSCTVTGKASDGSGHTASTAASISSPITITPSSATTKVGQTQSFSANVSVTWTASCGTIDSSGLFTAPATAQSCTITATAASGTPYTATANDTVTSSTPSTLNYTTYKYDNARDGLNAKETILTPANVNSSSFGKLFSAPVDGRLWAQPLYMSGITIGGAKHNVVFAATANDSVYAIDGDTGAQLWKVSLLTGGETPASASALHSSVQPQIGITGTPVIDPSTGTLYAVTQSGISGTYFHRLHALDITTGKERFGAPVVINTGGWSSAQHLQRPGLTLANGTIYIAFSSNEDVAPYHGWVFGYSADTLNQVAVWNATSGGHAGGIWMSGAAIAADAAGDLYLNTGNGDWSGATEYGQSSVRLSPTLAVQDYFTPIAHSTESGEDKDLGSGGVLLLPPNTGAHPTEAVLCSKLDLIYVLDLEHMGELGSGSDDVVQQVNGQLGASSGVQFSDRCFSTPAFWNNNIYFIGNNDVVKQFSFNPATGLMSTTPTHKNTYAFQFPGGQPVISSNGNSGAILWSIDWKTGTLRAYDATNVSTSLYASPNLGAGIKFTVPTVVNGHVYVGLGSSIAGLGLLHNSTGCTPPASPGVNVCAPTAGGSYTSPVNVTAAGTGASGSVSRMEVWSDGTKVGNYAGDQVNASISLATGSHALTVIEVDSTGAFIKSTPVSITVH